MQVNIITGSRPMQHIKKTAFVLSLLLLMNFYLVGRSGLVRAQEPPLSLVVGQTGVFTSFNYYTTSFVADAAFPLPEEKGVYAEGNAAGAYLYASPGYAGSGIAELGVSLSIDTGGYSFDEVRDWPVTISADISFYEISAQWQQGQGEANAGIYFLWNTVATIGFNTNDTGTRQKSAVINVSTRPDGSPLTLGDLYLKPDIPVRLVSQASTDPAGTVTCSSSVAATLSSITVRFLEQQGSTTTTTALQQDFSVDVRAYPRSGEAPLTVNFTGTATEPVTAWLWDFGDTTTSTGQYPVHTYAGPGLYTIGLSATGKSGSAQIIKPDFILVGAPVIRAGFFAEPVSGAPPLTVQFIDRSSGPVTSWFWEFGDGTTSSEQSPEHTYAEQGRYSVALTVTGKQQSDTRFIFEHIIVTENPVFADFTAEPSSGSVPLTVQFINTSSGDIAEQLWDFGDGQYSDEQHPQCPMHFSALPYMALSAGLPPKTLPSFCTAGKQNG